MKSSIRWLIAGWVLRVTVLCAQDIIGFKNGLLTFENTDPGLSYRVEYRSSLTEPEDWTSQVSGIQSSEAEITIELELVRLPPIFDH